MKRLGLLVFAAIAALAGCDDDPEPTCEGVENACETDGALQCNEANDAVETCSANDDGCLVWTESTACDAGETCVVDGDTVECQPEACTDACDEGDAECDGNVIMTCQEGANGCLVMAESEDCEDDDEVCDESGGEPECVEECNDACDTIGETQCDDDTIQECEAGVNGCNVWADGDDCAALDPARVCDIVGEGAECVLECIDECDTEDATQCDGTVIQTCTEGTAGCLAWVDGDDCADQTPVQSCDDTGGEAECVLGCDDECPAAGDEQCNAEDTAIQTCTMGEDGCLHWVDDSCATMIPPRVCDDAGGTPECVLTCVDTCTPEDSMRCGADNNSVETCEVGGDGCLAWTVTTVCEDAVTFCDASGATPECTACASECTEGDTQCNGSIIETCGVGTNRCIDWVADTDCATLEPLNDCVDDGTTAACVLHEGAGTCADPKLITGRHYTLAGDDFYADFTNNVTFSGTGCVARTGTPDVVYAVDLLANQTVRVSEWGAIDSVLSIQTTCGGAEACEESSDLGSNESGGLTYTADVDSTVYLIIEAWYSTDEDIAYDIHIDVTDPEICDNGLDDDEDTYADCDDPDCIGVGACPDGSCADPIVVTAFPFVWSGEDFLADYTGSLVLDTDTCEERTEAQDEAVFEVELLAGERLTFRERGALDAQLSILTGDCATDLTCQASTASESTGLVYTATADVTLQLVVEANLVTTTSTAYDILIDVVTAEICDNGLDDDGDGPADCADGECFGVGTCPAASCESPIPVTTDSYTIAGSVFIDDFDNNLVLDATTCVERTAAQREAVFSVDLAAGETVRFTEPGPLDSVLSIQVGTCDSTCVRSSDTPESVSYKATEATTVYLIAEAYSETTTAGYEIHVEVVPVEDCANTIDDDEDGDIDCDDADCFGVGTCEWPLGTCGNPVVVDSDTFTDAGTNWTADWNNVLVLDAATCVERTETQAEAVYMVELAAGERVTFTEPGSLDSVLSIQVGTCGSTCVQSSDTPESVSYKATEATTVYLIAESYFENSTSAYDIHVDITLTELCDNTVDDDGDGDIDCEDADCLGVGTCPAETCASPIVIDPVTGSYAGNTTGHSNGYGQAAPDAWYSFTLTGDADVDVLMESTSFDTYLHLLSGTCGALVSVAYDDDCTGTRDSCVSATLGAGTYYIVVEGYFSYSYGAYTLDVDVTPLVEGGLIISEMMEGSSNNKALEFTNLSWDPIDLSTCTLSNYANGSATPSGTPYTLPAYTLGPDETYVICHSAGTVTGGGIIPDATCDATTTLFFNGDDAFVLACDGAVVDAFGDVGFDPGDAWGADTFVTQNNTLRRNCDVIAGDTVIDDDFDPASQWTGFGVDVFDGLGVHCP